MKKILIPHIGVLTLTLLVTLMSLLGCSQVDQPTTRAEQNDKSEDQSSDQTKKRKDTDSNVDTEDDNTSPNPNTDDDWIPIDIDPNDNDPPTPTNSPKPPIVVGECYKASLFVCKIEELITKKTNSYRASQGRNELTHDQKISFVSRDWSQKQGQRGSIGHDGFPGNRNSVYKSEFAQSITVSGENVAMHGGLGSGPESDQLAEKVASAFATMWWNSAGHRANMLNSGFKTIGVGVYKTSSGAWYATQIFD